MLTRGSSFETFTKRDTSFEDLPKREEEPPPPSPSSPRFDTGVIPGRKTVSHRDRLSAPKIGNKPTRNIVKAKATFDYTAEEDNELEFNEGDIINVLNRDDSGWWEGECNGRVGMFPGNYVELISREIKQRCKVTSLCSQTHVKVVFDFTADTDDELTIKEGDIIVVETKAEGWILGINDKGQQGLFPANYVEDIIE